MQNQFLKMTKIGMALAFGLCVNNVFAVDACSEVMGHSGDGTTLNDNASGSISGTPWGYEQWFQGGNNSMTYYKNGTFKASWSGASDYLARVGYRYGDNGAGVDHNKYHYTVDYKYTKMGTASYGYIGVYGWTTSPEVEYYIVDDWYSKPSNQYIGDEFGKITVDGATYTIHAFLRQQEPSKSGTSTFLQIFSVRDTPRQCGHIDISAHFKKWDELFTGQTAQLKGSKGGASATLKFGNVTEVMLMNEAGGNATGTVDYTYFNMSDNGEASEVTPPKDIPRKPFGGVAATIPGIIEAEKFDEGNEGVSYFGATGSSNTNGDHTYRGEDYSLVDIVNGGTGKAIGYTAEGEWLEYTVNVASDGEYNIEANVSNGQGSGTLKLSLDGKNLTTLTFTGNSDGDWNAYEKATGKVTLTKGEHVLRVTIATANTNVDYVKFSLVTTGIERKMNLRCGVVGTYQVFDMQGRSLGAIDVSIGASVEDVLRAHFYSAGNYLVKRGNWMKAFRIE